MLIDGVELDFCWRRTTPTPSLKDVVNVFRVGKTGEDVNRAENESEGGGDGGGGGDADSGDGGGDEADPPRNGVEDSDDGIDDKYLNGDCNGDVDDDDDEDHDGDVTRQDDDDDEFPSIAFEASEPESPCLMFISCDASSSNEHASTTSNTPGAFAVSVLEIVSNARHLELYTAWPKGDYLATLDGDFLQTAVFLHRWRSTSSTTRLAVKFASLRGAMGGAEGGGRESMNELRIFQISVHLVEADVRPRHPISPFSPLTSPLSSSPSPFSSSSFDLDAVQRLLASAGLPLSSGAETLMRSVKATQAAQLARMRELRATQALQIEELRRREASADVAGLGAAAAPRFDVVDAEAIARRLEAARLMTTDVVAPLNAPQMPPLLRPHLQAMEARILAQVDERMMEMQKKIDEKLEGVLEAMGRNGER